MNVVILTSDTDCDGTSYGAHRISIPNGVDHLIEGPDAILKHAIATDQMSSFYDVVDEVLTVPEFMRRFGHNLTARDRTYFAANGYTSHHIAPHWNPWAGPDGDDTIGIPALDTRYDD